MEKKILLAYNITLQTTLEEYRDNLGGETITNILNNIKKKNEECSKIGEVKVYDLIEITNLLLLENIKANKATSLAQEINSKIKQKLFQ